MVVYESDEVIAQTPSYLCRKNSTPSYFFPFLLLVCAMHGLVVVIYGLSGASFSNPLDQTAFVELVSWGAETDQEAEVSKEDVLSQQAVQRAEPAPVPVKMVDVAVQKAPEVSRSLGMETPLSGKPVAQAKPVRPATAAPSNKANPSQATQADASVTAVSAAGATTQAGAFASATGSDKGPKPLNNAKPPYPHAAVRAKQEGVVFLNLDVGVDGVVSRAELASSSGVDSLDQSALATALKWTFSPAVRDGRPVAERVRIGVRFDLNSL